MTPSSSSSVWVSSLLLRLSGLRTEALPWTGSPRKVAEWIWWKHFEGRPFVEVGPLVSIYCLLWGNPGLTTSLNEFGENILGVVYSSWCMSNFAWREEPNVICCLWECLPGVSLSSTCFTAVSSWGLRTLRNREIKRVNEFGENIGVVYSSPGVALQILHGDKSQMLPSPGVSTSFTAVSSRGLSTSSSSRSGAVSRLSGLEPCQRVPCWFMLEIWTKFNLLLVGVPRGPLCIIPSVPWWAWLFTHSPWKPPVWFEFLCKKQIKLNDQLASVRKKLLY